MNKLQITIVAVFLVALSVTLIIVALPYLGVDVSDLPTWFTLPLALAFIVSGSVVTFEYFKYTLKKEFGEIQRWVWYVSSGFLVGLIFGSYAIATNNVLSWLVSGAGMLVTFYGIYLLSFDPISSQRRDS